MNIYDSHIEGALELPKRERERFLCALIEYLWDGREPDLPSGPALGLFKAIRPTLNTSQARSKAGRSKAKSSSNPESKQESNCEQNLEQTGSKTGSKTESNANQSTDQTSDQNDIKTAIKNESNGAAKNKNKEKAKAFSPPYNPPEEKRGRSEPPPLTDSMRRVIARLNELTQSSYKPEAKDTRRLIHARMAEGYTEDDLMAVVEHKARQWLGDDEMARFLRPETLFRASKFEGYLQDARRCDSKKGEVTSFDEYA